MAIAPGKPVCWRFDAVTVDAATFRVLIDGEPRPLEPKSFRLLQFLIENRHRAVTKEEIFQAVWTGAFVTDNALTRAVAQIRKAIGDDPRQPRYIETIPTVGYRFRATVEEVIQDATVEAPDALARPPEPPQRWPAPLVLVGIAGLVLAAALVAIRVWPRPEASPPSSVRAVQFSASSGLDLGASFSPDGNVVAYASDKSGSFEIYLKSFDSSARELQVTTDGGQNLYPAFSPDGRTIAYASLKTGGLFRVPAIGGTPQRLTDFGVQPVWSPDGKQIVFRSAPAASLSTTDYYWPAESSLWMVPASGGAPQQITGIPGSPPGGQSFASFSPDGAQLRFVNNLGAESSLWVYEFANRSFRKLFGSERYPFSDATFAPDDARLWFVNWRLNGDIGIWEQKLDPATLEPRGEPAPVYVSSFGAPLELTLSPDGKRLAFTAAVSDSSIDSMNIDGTGERRLTSATNYRHALLRSSADGTRVAYTSFPRNGASEVWTMQADGSGAALVGQNLNFGTFGADDQYLYAVSLPAAQGRRMERYTLRDHSRLDLGPLPDGANQINCSPGDCAYRIFHNDREPKHRLLVQETATGKVRVLAERERGIGFGRYSRDGRWIAAESTMPSKGETELIVLPADGATQDVIQHTRGLSFPGGWMPDNDHFFIAGLREGVWNLYLASRITHLVRPISAFTSPRLYLRYPDWLAGDRVVFEYNETKGNLFVAELP